MSSVVIVYAYESGIGCCMYLEAEDKLFSAFTVPCTIQNWAYFSSDQQGRKQKCDHESSQALQGLLYLIRFYPRRVRAIFPKAL